MKRHWPQLIIVISGAVLIVMGMVAIGVQLFNQFMHTILEAALAEWILSRPAPALLPHTSEWN